MKMQVGPGLLRGSIAAIPSKSDVHRQLICAALAHSPTRIRLGATSEDIEATANCLRALGAQITAEPSALVVRPIWEAPQSAPVLDCGESGSTLRFLLPVAAALGCGATLTGRGRLPQRPNNALTDQLAQYGCTTKGEGLPLTLEGKLHSGRFTLPGDVSSQFITGLLFALPLLEGDSEMILTSPLQSAGYVDMTLDTLAQFAISVKVLPDGYLIPGGQQYTSPGESKADGDWSNAAFWLAAGALGGDVICTGLSPSSRQGDKAVVELLRRFGAQVTQTEDSVRVAVGTLHPAEIDAGAFPDLIPILSVMAANAYGDTVISNAARLRIKECDRLTAIHDLLTALGGRVTERPDGLIIHGTGCLTGGQTESFGDHRMAMSAAIAATACGGNVNIVGAEAVRKSYPGFFEDYQALGGLCRGF